MYLHFCSRTSKIIILNPSYSPKQYFSHVIQESLLFTFLIRRYIIDHDDPSLGKISLWQWIVRIVFLLLQIAPLLRYIDTLIYGLKSKIAGKTAGLDQWQSTFYRRMLDEDTNGALLRLFHCFLHSAPQAVIQLMFLVGDIVSAQGRASLKTGKCFCDIT